MFRSKVKKIVCSFKYFFNAATRITLLSFIIAATVTETVTVTATNARNDNNHNNKNNNNTTIQAIAVTPAAVGAVTLTEVQNSTDEVPMQFPAEVITSNDAAAAAAATTIKTVNAVAAAAAAAVEPTLPTLYLNVSEYPGELCNRECIEDEERICYFQFALEHYQAMGVACGNCARGIETDCYNPQCILGDGIEKGAMSINRQIPGPPIHVCENDYVIVDVTNDAHGTAATIHWHGIHMRDTPYMDGVPFVTQCPIQFTNTFRYEFEATEPGTQFYHSHSGHHKVNGQYGALIVRQPVSTTPTAQHYDYDLPEHYIFISDWMHSYGEQYVPGLPGSSGIHPDAMLINGRGVFNNPKTGERTVVPPTRYYLTPGMRYRFRVINAVSHSCPVALQIQNHSLIIVSSDSYDVEPRNFDTLVSNAGERYDFVLHANHTHGDYWIRATGMGNCETWFTEAFALLRYASNEADSDDDESRPLPQMPNYNETFPFGTVLNHPNSTCFDDQHNDHCVSELVSVEEDNELRYAEPDYKIYLAFNNYLVPNAEIFDQKHYTHFMNPRSNLTIVGAINKLSLIFPDYPPLTQPENIDESKYCDDFNWPEYCVNKRLCPCIHREQIDLGSIVELVLVDETDTVGRVHHPFHLHGYRFMVITLTQDPRGIPMTVASFKQLEHSRMLPRFPASKRPPFKDTVSIPSRGCAIVRFKADNPGFWIMHCHYEWHLAIGMGLLLQVGHPDEMVSAPTDFPKCGNYLPPVKHPYF